MLVESVLNLIFHLHAAELHHFGGHVLKYSSHNMETSSRMEFLAVGLKSNNCSDVSHTTIVAGTRTIIMAITVQTPDSWCEYSKHALFRSRRLINGAEFLIGIVQIYYRHLNDV